MTKLRIHFHLNRESLEKYLDKNGFKDSDEELSFQKYFQFLKVAHPAITFQEAQYIFSKTDIDGNGAISLEEILIMLKNYGIAVEDPRLLKNEWSSESFSSVCEEKRIQVQTLLVKFFTRLFKMINRNKLSLRRVFNDFDKARKGYMIFSEFKEMIQKVVKQISDEDAQIAFGMIDVNNSSTIDFQ